MNEKLTPKQVEHLMFVYQLVSDVAHKVEKSRPDVYESSIKRLIQIVDKLYQDVA